MYSGDHVTLPKFLNIFHIWALSQQREDVLTHNPHNYEEVPCARLTRECSKHIVDQSLSVESTLVKVVQRDVNISDMTQEGKTALLGMAGPKKRDR